MVFSIWIVFTEDGFNAYSCLFLILGVLFESVQGHQALSQVDGEPVSLALWNDPLGFLSSFSVRPASS